MLVKLSNLLRSTLEQQNEDKIKLSEELTLLKYFTDIEQQRFAGTIEVTIQSDINNESIYIPPMLLQPLLENALKFTWHHKGKKWVNVNLTKVNEQLVIQVSNPLPDISTSQKGTGTGLTNVKERLAVVYGNSANLTINTDGNTFDLTITMPWEQSL